MQSQYKDPPPYPGHSKYNQPGLRQSFSGSETSTDVSVSSTENLATCQRQEPQGEETQSANNLYSHMDMNAASPDSNYSILARLGMPPPPSRDEGKSSNPTFFTTTQTNGPYVAMHSMSAPVFTSIPQAPTHLAPPQWQGTHLASSDGQLNNHKTADYNKGLLSSFHNIPCHYVNAHSWYSDHAQTLSYLTSLPPPPEYPGLKHADSAETADSLHSSEIEDMLEQRQSQEGLNAAADLSSLQYISRLEADAKAVDLDTIAIATRATQMVSTMSEENRKLREMVNVYHKKVSKLQKFEFEIQRVQENYEALVKSSQKRERLELALKRRQEEDIKKLQAQNKELREKLERSFSASQRDLLGAELDLKGCLAEKNSLVNKLLLQNKELQSCKDRLELELASSRLEVEKQQAQIDFQASALASAQSTIQHLKEDLQKNQNLVEREEKLERAFATQKTVSARREQMEKQLRSNLETEIECLRARLKSDGIPESDGEETSCIAALKRMLSEKDLKMRQAEAEKMKWERRYLEEVTKNQLALQDSPEQKDVQLAALETTSVETERLIDEAKADKLLQMEQLYISNRCVAEMEAKVKSLQAQLAEKEAMVRVYQRSPMTRSSSVHTIYCSPIHSPRPSLVSTSTSHSRQSSSSDVSSGFRDYATMKPVKTGSVTALDGGKKLSVEEELRENFQNLNVESTTDPDDGRVLWQV